MNTSKSPHLSVAIFASPSLLPSIQQGMENLGHRVVLAIAPHQLEEVKALPAIDLAFVALSQEIEDAFETLEALLDQAPATLFDESENKEAWPPARWGQHLQPKLLKVARRQEPEKLLSDGMVDNESIVSEYSLPTSDEPDTLSWDFVEPVHAPLPEPMAMTDAEQSSAPEASEATPVFNGGFDFYDDEPSMLGTVEVPEIPKTVTEHHAPEASVEDRVRELATEISTLPETTATPAPEWDLSTFSLVNDEDIPPPAPPSKPSSSVTLTAPKWSFEGDEQASEEETVALREEAPLPPPLPMESTAPAETQQVFPVGLPTFTESPGLLFIGGGTGGPGALVQLMEHLPLGLPVPLVLFQPLPQGRQEVFVANLQKRTAIPVILGTEGQALKPGHITLLPDGATASLEDEGWLISAGNPIDTIASLGEDSGLILVSGSPGSWVIPAMEAAGMGALLLGQSPIEALESQTISTLCEIGLTHGSYAHLGEHVAERWGVAVA